MIWTTLALQPLLCGTWILGLLFLSTLLDDSSDPELTEALSWIFTLVNTLQVQLCNHSIYNMYGIGHMQCCTRRRAPANTHLKWVSHHMTMLAHVLTRACVLLSFARVLARRVVKNLLEHHKSFTMAILYEGPATINLVNMMKNHSGLLQESWPDSSSDSYLPNKDCDESLQAGTKIYRNK